MCGNSFQTTAGDLPCGLRGDDDFECVVMKWQSLTNAKRRGEGGHIRSSPSGPALNEMQSFFLVCSFAESASAVQLPEEGCGILIRITQQDVQPPQNRKHQLSIVLQKMTSLDGTSWTDSKKKKKISVVTFVQRQPQKGSHISRRSTREPLFGEHQKGQQKNRITT